MRVCLSCFELETSLINDNENDNGYRYRFDKEDINESSERKKYGDSVCVVERVDSLISCGP